MFPFRNHTTNKSPVSQLSYRMIIFLFLIFNSSDSIAQCPFQIKDCKGKCPRFTDLNHDSFCDYTIIAQKIVSDTIIIKDTHSPLTHFNTKNRSHINDSLKHNGLPTVSKPSKKYFTLNKYPDASSDQHVTQIQKQLANISSQKKPAYAPAVTLYNRYSLLLISGLSIGLYIISFMLAKLKVIEIRIHRKIWNILLTTTFLVTAFLGLLMVIQLNYSIQVKWFKPLLTWHVSFGIGMALISIFHFLWHWSYMKKIFDFRPHKSDK
jgi:hypothetical protein